MSSDMIVAEDGRVTLPEALRAALGARPGDRIFWSQDPDGAIRLRTRPADFARLRGVTRIPGAYARIEDWIEEARGARSAAALHDRS